MRIRSLRRSLWIAGAGCITVAAGIVALGLSTPLSVELPEMVDEAGPPATATERTAVDWPPLEVALAACQTVLQRPLVDPTPPEPAPKPEKVSKPTPQRQPPPLSIVGTIVEAGASRALLQTRDGKIEVRAEGDRLERLPDVTLVTIAVDRVVVEFRGETFELMVPQRETLDAFDVGAR